MLTKLYLTACVVCTALVHLQLVTPADLAFSQGAVLRGEPWRLLTAFCYSGGCTPAFLLQLHVISSYGAVLERLVLQDPYYSFGPPALRVWAGALLAGALILLAGAARPSELQQPFYMTAAAFFCVGATSHVPWPLVAPHAAGCICSRVRILAWLALGAVGAPL
jgi:hypothetical protein